MLKAHDIKKEGDSRSIVNMVGVMVLIGIVFVTLVFLDGWNFRFKTMDSSLWLGVETIELTPDVKAQYDLLDSNGLLITRVFRGSPAQTAGILEGDVLQRWNGISIINQDQFQYLIQTTDLNDRVTFTVDRAGKQALVYGRVGVRPGGI